jgi:sodium-dependent dicarboxylate transporter 2/3/5
MPAFKKKGFVIGLVVFIAMIVIPSPNGLNPIGWSVAAVVALMAIWWATEAIPVPITALLPLALFPLIGVTSFKEAALPYANPNIYLFLGGFMLALGIERSGLHKRMALKIILVEKS